MSHFHSDYLFYNNFRIKFCVILYERIYLIDHNVKKLLIIKEYKIRQFKREY